MVRQTTQTVSFLVVLSTFLLPICHAWLLQQHPSSFNWYNYSPQRRRQQQQQQQQQRLDLKSTQFVNRSQTNFATQIEATTTVWNELMTISLAYDEDQLFVVASPTVLLVVAVSLGVIANGWIQRMLSGDQGLSSFLSDGKGFQKSRFRPLTTSDVDRAISSDPLPWLRLPKFDFVDVAGQDDDNPEMEDRRRIDAVNKSSGASIDDEVVTMLERLQGEMNTKLAEDNIVEAQKLGLEIEETMKKNGVAFLIDPSKSN